MLDFIQKARGQEQGDAPDAPTGDAENPTMPLTRSQTRGESMAQYQTMLDCDLQQHAHTGHSEKNPNENVILTKIRMGLVHRGEAEDSMTYHTADLSQWSSLSSLHLTVWGRPSLWSMCARSLAISLCVILVVIAATFLLDLNPSYIDPSDFTKICQFLNVFVGLLLGFFMSASVNRWWRCAEGFMSILDAIRDLQMQLYGLGVPEEKCDKGIRYAVMSSWILNAQLHIEALRDDEQKEKASKMMWKKLASGEGLDPTFCTVTTAEREALTDIADPAGLLWMWVALLICRMAEDGDIPPMSSPTYGRILNIAQNAHQGIRIVRASIIVQAPFIYAQMLSSLVHINNIINAVSFGATLGSSIALSMYNTAHPQDASMKQVVNDFQTVLVSFTFSVFGPFIYQALLEVSIAIAQPFGNKDGVIPTWRIMAHLLSDLHDGKKMVQRIDWKQARFNKSTPSV